MKYLNIIPWVLCLLMLAYIGQCTHKGTVQPETIVKDSLRIDTVVKVIDNTKHYPKPERDTVYYPDSIYLYPDSAKCHSIASEFYKSKIYNRHIIIDSIGFIDLRDSVYKNELYGYAVKSKFKQLTITKYETKTITQPKRNKLLAGLILTGNKEYFGASPSLILKTKKDNCFYTGYDLINGNISVGYFAKLGGN
jgi:hypothetical protein